MALPTTNLTIHLNASDNDHLWVNWQAGTPYHNGVPVDGSSIEIVDDDDGKDLSLWYDQKSIWRSTTPLMLLPCLDFDGVNDLYQAYTHPVSGSAKPLSEFITNSAFTVLASFYVEAVAGTSAAAYDNEALIAESAGYWGIHFRNNGGAYSVQCFNWDTNEDKVTLSINLNTSYVLMYRHQSGNLYASLNGGGESSVASGNTGSLTGGLTIGKGLASPFYNGRIGEIAIYNAALSGSDLTDAISHFTSRWLASAFIARPPFIVRQAVKQASRH